MDLKDESIVYRQLDKIACIAGLLPPVYKRSLMDAVKAIRNAVNSERNT